MIFFNPVVFVKEFFFGFCNLADIWLQTQAAQACARESARILHIHWNQALQQIGRLRSLNLPRDFWLFKFSFWTGKRAQPVIPPKTVWNRSETTLKRPAHHLRLLCMLRRIQHHCFILLFRCRNDVLILYVLVSCPDHFEGQCPYLRSASFPGNGQRPVTAPKGVWNRSETTLKRLPAHHLRLSIYARSFGYCHCFLLPFSCRKDVLIFYALVSLPDPFEWQWPRLRSAAIPERKKTALRADPKRSATGRKPFGNKLRLTISDSMLFRLQHHCFILLFRCTKDVDFVCFGFSLFSGNGAKPREHPQRV